MGGLDRRCTRLETERLRAQLVAFGESLRAEGFSAKEVAELARSWRGFFAWADRRRVAGNRSVFDHLYLDRFARALGLPLDATIDHLASVLAELGGIQLADGTRTDAPQAIRAILREQCGLAPAGNR